MGQALSKLGWSRGSYLVSTKLFWGLEEGVNTRNTLNRKYLLEAMVGSLKRFGLEYVDLVYCHRDDPQTPVSEIVWAMHNIIERGQALYWGTSEWEASRILEALQFAKENHLHAPMVEQPVYNLFEQHRFGPEYLPVYADSGYGSTTWSPLASGLLTGKYQGGIPDGSRGSLESMQWMRDHLTDQEKLEKVEALKPIAADLDASLAQMSLAWCLQNPYVSSVITGASRPEQIVSNMKAGEVADRFTPEIMKRIESVLAA